MLKMRIKLENHPLVHQNYQNVRKPGLRKFVLKPIWLCLHILIVLYSPFGRAWEEQQINYCDKFIICSVWLGIRCLMASA